MRKCDICGKNGESLSLITANHKKLGYIKICSECWDEWKQRQMLLINHYGLNVRDPQAREFLVTNLRAFLFAEGDDQAEIDASREGNVSW